MSWSGTGVINIARSRKAGLALVGHSLDRIRALSILETDEELGRKNATIII